MLKRYALLLSIFLLFVYHSAYAQLTVSFSSIPAANAGIIQTCQNSSVTFTSTSLNVPTGATISWDFPGGNPSSSNTIGPHNVNYSTAGNYTATLTIDGLSSTVNVSVSNVLNSPNLEIENFLTFFGYIQDTLANGDIVMAYCQTPAQIYNSFVQFDFTIPLYPPDHTILVNWGDGSSNSYPGDIAVLSHIFDCTSNNLYNANVTVISPSGCVASQSYPIYSGTPPQMSITGNSSNHCNPEPYSFIINSNNIPGTEFEVLFSEPGAVPVTFSGPFPLFFEYVFGENSCGQNAVISGPGGTPISYNNAYAASLLAQNFCGSSFLSIGPIYVGDPPIAIIDVNPDDYACVGENVTIQNISELGITTGPTGCNPVNKSYWSISPNTGYTINSGTLGNGTNPNWVFWTNGSTNLNLTFNDFGTYYIQLIQANNCGADTIVDSICIVAPVLADFTTNVLEGCTPLEINTTTLPYIPSCILNSAEYSWTVTSNGNATCPGEGQQPTYLAGTSSDSFEPILLFTNPGIYELELIIALTNPIPGTLCVADTQFVTLTVGQGPNMILETYEICQNDTITLTNQIEDCYSGTNVFNWTIFGNPPYVSDLTEPTPVVSFSQFGVFPISVEMTNNCSTATFNTLITVIEEPTLSIIIPAVACANTPITLEALVGGSASAGLWTVSPNIGTITLSNSNLTSYIPTNDYTGTVTFTFTTNDAPALCGQINESLSTTYELEATVDAGVYVTLCENNQVVLSGAYGGAASGVTWTDNAGGTFFDLNNPTTNYTPPSNFIGTITLTLTTDDPPGSCDSATDIATIVLVEQPNVIANPNLLTCEGQPIGMNSSFSGNTSGVQWGSNFGTFSDPNVNNTTFTPIFPYSGIAEVYVFSLGSAPCPADTAFTTLIVEPIPYITDTVFTFCTGGSFTFDPNSNPNNVIPSNTAFTWTVNGNPNISGGSSQVTPTSTLSQTLTSSSNNPETVIYTVTPVITSSLNCFGAPFTVVVNVIPTPDINPIPDLDVCEFANITINFSGTATDFQWTNSNINIGLTNSGNGNLFFEALNGTANFITSAVSVTPIYELNGISCSGFPTSFNIQVTPAPLIDQIIDLTYCVGNNVPFISFSSPTVGTTLTWTNNNAATGLGSNGVTQSPAFVANNTSNFVEESVVTVIGIANSCPSEPMEFSIFIIPVPTMSTPNNVTSCINENLSIDAFVGIATDYVWTNSNPDIGLTISGNSNVPTFVTTNNSSNPISAIITSTPEFTLNALTCFGSPTNFSITVAPEPIANPVADIVACNGDNVAQVAFSGNSNAFTWSMTNANIGSPTSGTGNLPAFTAVNNTNSPISSDISITPQYVINGVTCDGTDETFNITVNHTPTTDPIADITACDNSTVDQVDISGTGTNYSWSASGGTIGLASNTGSNFLAEFTSINNDAINNSSTITMIPEFTGNGLTCVGNSSSFQYIILPVPVVGPVLDAEYCSNEISNVVVFLGTGTSFAWANDNTDIGLGANGTGNILSFTTNNNTNLPIQGEIEVTPILIQNNVSCGGLPITFNIIVNPAPIVTSINDTTICNGEPLNLVNITGTATSYSWVNNNTNIGLAASGADFIPAFTSQNTSNNLPAVSQITITPNFAGGVFNCPGAISNFNITVNPTPIVDALGNVVLCDEQNANPVVFSGTANQYNWTNSQTSIGLAAGGLGNTPPYVATNTSNEPVLANLTVTPTFINNNVSCDGAATVFSITVNPQGQINPIDDVLSCNELTTNPILFATNNLGGSTAYNWNNNNTSFGLGVSQNNVTSINGFTVNSSLTGVNTAVVQVTPTYTNAGLSCPGDGTNFQIQVLPTPTVNALPDYTYCFNSQANIANFTGVATNFAWTNNNTEIGLSNTGNGNIPVFAANNSSITTINGILVVTPQYEFNNLVCSGNIMDFSITVAPNPVVTPIDDIAFCNGDIVPNINFTGTSNTFNWNFSGANIGNVLLNGNAFIPGFTATNNGLLPISSFVSVNTSFVINNLTCQGSPTNFNVFVNPTPTLNPTADIDDCHNSVVNNITFTGTGNNYAWEATNPAVGLNSPSGNNTVGSFTMFNVSPSNNVSDIIVTPQYIANGIACSGSTDTFNILVHLTPQVDFIPNQSVCNGVTTNPISFTGTGNNFTWTNNNPNIGLPMAGNGNIGSFSATNPFGLPIQGVINVTPSLNIGSNVCAGIPSSFSIQVNPSPVVNQVPNMELCTQTLTNPVGFLGTGTTYQWFNNNITVGLSPSGTNTIPAFFAQSDPFGANVSQIEVVPIFQGLGYTCVGDTMEFTINILPTPSANPISNQTVCNNGLTNEVIISGNGTNYDWFSSNTGIGSGLFGNDIIPSFIGVSNSAAPQSATFTITPYFNGSGFQCIGTPSTFTVTVIPTASIDNVPNETYCSGINVPQLDYTGLFTQVQWNNNNTGIGLVGSGGNSLPSFVSSNSSITNILSSTITAAPFYVLNGVSCSGQPITHQIEVLPLVSVTSLPDLSFCAGDLAPSINVVSSGNGISWISSNVAIGLGSGFTNNIPAFNVINNGNSTETTSVTITPTFTNSNGIICVGQVENYEITVNPTPIFDPVADITVCNNSPLVVNFGTNIPSNIEWTASPNPNILNVPMGPQTFNFIVNTPNNISNVLQNYTYTATINSPNGCVGNPISFNTQVIPEVVITSQNSTEICSGNPINFAFSSNIVSQYQWVGNVNPFVNNISTTPQTGPIISDILVNNSQNAQVVTYTITPVSIFGNCIGSAQNILVNVNAAPLLTSPTLVNSCDGVPLDYTLTSNAPVDFQWYGDPNPNINGITTTISSSSSISDVLSLIGTNTQNAVYYVVVSNAFNTNCQSPLIPINFAVFPNPQVAPMSETICSGETLDIMLEANENSTFTWYANNNDAVLGESLALQTSNTVNNILVNQSPSQTEIVMYNVTATSTTTGCVGNTSQLPVTVNPIPALSFNAPNILCSNTPITFNNSSSTGASYLWDFGNGNQSNAFFPTNIFNESGLYAISLTGTYTETGCSNAITQSIFIGGTPDVSFTASDNLGCLPAFIQFTNTSENPGSTFEWNFGDGTTSNEPIVADHYYEDAGCFDVTMTVTTAQGCVNSLTYTDFICAYPTPEALFYVTDPAQLSTNNEFNLVNLSLNGHTYFWDLGDGTTTNAFEPIHSYPDENGNYIITLIATNEAGCTDTAWTQVQVKQEDLIYVPNSFTPNGDMTNNVFIPILTAGFVESTYELQIFDRWGLLVFNSRTIGEGWDGTYRNLNAPDGTYIWKISVLLYDAIEYKEYIGHVNLIR